MDLSPLQHSYVNYLHWPLPCAKDNEIAGMIETLVSEPNALTNDLQAEVLSVFAERMAVLAVRQHSRDFIMKGLLASALALSVHRDFRDIISALALLYRAAELIGEHPRELFRSAARRLPPEIADWLVSFAGRNRKDRSPEAFGFVEKYGADGFQFERNW